MQVVLSDRESWKNLVIMNAISYGFEDEPLQVIFTFGNLNYLICNTYL